MNIQNIITISTTFLTLVYSAYRTYNMVREMAHEHQESRYGRRHAIGNSSHDTYQINNICPCCSELLSSESITMLPCDHIMHSKCLKKCITNSSGYPSSSYSCPTCGRKMSSIEINYYFKTFYSH